MKKKLKVMLSLGCLAALCLGAAGCGKQSYDDKMAELGKTVSVTFDPNGGKFADGTTDSKTATKQIAVPAFDAYLPTREGGYTFLGWYLADENGNMTDDTIPEGEIIYNNITLIAKWAEPLTIEGLISVAGTYEYERTVIDVPEKERLSYADVLLQ